MPRLSVITPFHNTPKDLFYACADSVLSQSMSDFEWIIIDDGSERDSAKFLKNFCEGDSRIRLFRQEAQGVSVARNSGLEEKMGEFFTFVDSDDIVSPDFFEEALEVAARTQADIVYGVLRDTKRPINPSDIANIPERVYRGDEKERFLRCVISGKDVEDVRDVSIFRLFTIGPRIYRSAVFSHCRFETSMELGEDSLFNAVTVAQAQTVALSPHIWYTYIVHDSSSVYRQLSHEQALHMLASFNRYQEIGRENAWDDGDLGMRFLDSFLHILGLYAENASFKHIWSLARDVARLDAARAVTKVHLSNYHVRGRMHAIILYAAVASMRCGVTFPIACLIKGRHVIKSFRG